MLERGLEQILTHEFLPFPHPYFFECDCYPYKHIKIHSHLHMALIGRVVEPLELEFCWTKCVHRGKASLAVYNLDSLVIHSVLYGYKCNVTT